MKNPFRFAIASLALLGATIGLQAQVAVKVVTIDMEQLFEKYYKTEAQQTKLRENEKKAKEAIDGMKKDGEALVAQAKELQEQTKSAILSEDARKKAQSDLEAKVGEIRQKEGEIQQFIQQVQQSFQKQLGQYQQQAAEEISKVATEIAKKKGATLVLNQGANTVVIFADPSFSITEEVLEAINKDRPPAITVAPAAPAK
ncbi:MAG: OmpH family outer membrane protein [Opitutaceae bacterium]